MVIGFGVSGDSSPSGAPSSAAGSPHTVAEIPARHEAVPSPVTKSSGAATDNPSANITPDPDFLDDCSTSYDDSPSCVSAILQAIGNARAQEGLPAMTLPSDWESLTPEEQLYVATNLERVARGLPALSGMATALDQSAAQGAADNEDPEPPSGFPWTSWGSNWAGAVGNPLEAIYYWMYDDGEGSGNVDCTQTNTSGCWGHRDNILMSLDCQPCVMGTGFNSTAYEGYPSWGEILVDSSGSPQLDYSWSQVVPYLADPWDPFPAQPNLLVNPNFGAGMGSWNVASGQNWAIYDSSSAPVGQTYLETNSGSASSPTVEQDASAPSQGNSYQGSVYLRSPSSQPIGVALVIWAVGGSSNEDAQDDFTVSSSSWTRYYTDLDVAGSGHTGLIFQLYIGNSGTNLDVDGAMLQNTGVSDAGFEQSGLGAWNVASGQNWAVYDSSAAPMGSDYLQTNSGGASDPSVYQDATAIPAQGDDYQGSVFLSSPSSTPVNVSLVIWALGGSNTEEGESEFTVSSSTWTQYFTDLDVTDSGHNDLRFQVYVDTAGVNLDMDGAMLEYTGVPDAAFDQSGLGPWVVPSGANWAIGSGSGGVSGSGQNWLETNTGSDNSSFFYEDLSTDPLVGHSYTGSVFLKSLSGAPISVAIVIWALGGPSPVEEGETTVTVGSTWQPYSAVLDVTDPGYSDLRMQVYVSTPGLTLGADFASLPDVAADS